DLLHDLEVDAEQVVAAHSRLAGNAGRDDADIRTFDRRVIAGARKLGIETLDRRGLGNVEPLALRDTVRDVEEDDVAQFLQAGQMCQRATDHSRTDKCDLLARHRKASSQDPNPWPTRLLARQTAHGHSRYRQKWQSVVLMADISIG